MYGSYWYLNGSAKWGLKLIKRFKLFRVPKKNQEFFFAIDYKQIRNVLNLNISNVALRAVINWKIFVTNMLFRILLKKYKRPRFAPTFKVSLISCFCVTSSVIFGFFSISISFEFFENETSLEIANRQSEQVRVKLVITNLTLICSDYLLFLVIQQLTGSESRSRHVDSLRAAAHS